MFGKEIFTYLSAVQFLKEFATTCVIVGGIFANKGCLEPEFLIGRNRQTGQHYIWANFTHSRRRHVFLPLSVFETPEETLGDPNFRVISVTKLVAA